jgi:hypothetical protein
MFQVRLTFPVTLADAFANILGLLRHRVAEQGEMRGVSPCLIGLICARIARLAHRIERLLARDPANLPPQRPSRHIVAGAEPSKPRAPNPLPRGFNWLNHLLPGTSDIAAAAATAASQLYHLLRDPEIAARISADPGLGRAIRPLCHMLGLTPPAALRTKPPRRPAPSHPAEPVGGATHQPSEPRHPPATAIFRR